MGESFDQAQRIPSATKIAAAVRNGDVSARQVVQQSLDRIAALNGTLNAFIEVRANDALAAADRLDERIANGDTPGKLTGVPIAVKDSFWESGVPATNGSRTRTDFIPNETVLSVQRMLDEDAIVVGRTNVPEFCYRGNCNNELYGATVNPWDVTKTSGGSSGGAASAVASGMVPIALGSDGGGSIRIPASFCGIVGFKPSFGVVPRTPGWLGWYNLNHIGPLTQTVEDAALAMEVLAGIDSNDRASAEIPASLQDGWHEQEPLRGLRAAYSRDLGFAFTNSDVQERFTEVLTQLELLGVELVEVHPNLADPGQTWFELATADNLASEGELLESGQVGRFAHDLIVAGREITGARYAAARNAQHEYSTAWDAFLAGFDVFLTPAMETTAFDASLAQPETLGGHVLQGLDEEWCRFVYPFNLTGHPAASIPMPTKKGELPIGLQVITSRYHDARLMRTVASLAAAFGIATAPDLQTETGQNDHDFPGRVLSNGARVRRVSWISDDEPTIELDQ